MSGPGRSMGRRGVGDGADIAVVIPAFNAADTLDAQLEALLNQAEPGRVEICVVDNGSTDTTAASVARFTAERANVQLVVATERQSAGYARNVGVRATTADHILFCDADDLVEPNWIAVMREALDHHGMVGGFIEEDSLNTPEILAWRQRRDTERLVVAHGYLEHAIGANCGVTRQAWTAVGGWAECFPGGAGEDVEFSWRIQQAGYSLGTVPRSVVRYRHKTSMKQLAQQYYRRGVNGHLVCRVYRKQIAERPEAASLGSHTVDEPQLATGWRTVATRLAREVPATITTVEARGRVVRQIASGVGWLVAGARYRRLGATAADRELAGLLENAASAGDPNGPGSQADVVNLTPNL